LGLKDYGKRDFRYDYTAAAGISSGIKPRGMTGNREKIPPEENMAGDI